MQSLGFFSNMLFYFKRGLYLEVISIPEVIGKRKPSSTNKDRIIGEMARLKA